MNINTEDLKKKIIYRSTYRGNKEMDALLGSFTKKYINTFNDKELRYRNRHLDLMTNESTRDTFMIRSQVISGIRQFMLNERFMEVATRVFASVFTGIFTRFLRAFL